MPIGFMFTVCFRGTAAPEYVGFRDVARAHIRIELVYSRKVTQ